MRIIRVFRRDGNIIVAERVSVADSFIRRGIGLLGRSHLGKDEGMLITRTRSIHSFFMRFMFDAVYLDRDNRVVCLVRGMPPNRPGPFLRQARNVLELPAGKIDETGLSIGDELIFTS